MRLNDHIGMNNNLVLLMIPEEEPYTLPLWLYLQLIKQIALQQYSRFSKEEPDKTIDYYDN